MFNYCYYYYYYEKGKSGKKFRKNTFRCKVKRKREERSLQKPRDTKRGTKASDKSMAFTNIS